MEWAWGGDLILEKGEEGWDEETSEDGGQTRRGIMTGLKEKIKDNFLKSGFNGSEH